MNGLIEGYGVNFAEQRDVNTLTARPDVCASNIRYTARLRCAESRTQTAARVNELMEIVGLVPVAGVRAHKLTGGQLKLLSVAVGLVQHPTVLFLDEPTTGLDSTSASAVMECVPFAFVSCTLRVENFMAQVIVRHFSISIYVTMTMTMPKKRECFK